MVIYFPTVRHDEDGYGNGNGSSNNNQSMPVASYLRIPATQRSVRKHVDSFYSEQKSTDGLPSLTTETEFSGFQLVSSSRISRQSWSSSLSEMDVIFQPSIVHDSRECWDYYSTRSGAHGAVIQRMATLIGRALKNY